VNANILFYEHLHIRDVSAAAWAGEIDRKPRGVVGGERKKEGGECPTEGLDIHGFGGKERVVYSVSYS